MKKQKKLMLLGSIRYLLPVIQTAHEEGYYVITADYLPDGIAHQYSDEYVNVSIIDQELVLKVAREKKIDGIMSFGVDPGVVSAAYVQEQMGLPSIGPYESVKILQNKDKFRAFLAENGFNVPVFRNFSSIEDALSDLTWCPFPVIVKPTDSAGSKGVSRVDSASELKDALEYAFSYALKGKVIVEEYIEKSGCSSDSDSFCYEGQLKIVTFSAQRFDDSAANPYTPAAYSWPSTFTVKEEALITDEIQRLLHLLKMETSIYNLEARIGNNGKPYIMEVSPRGGGNRLAEMIKFATGVDMIKASVRASVGDPIEELTQRPYEGLWAEIILHSDRCGFFDHLEIGDSLQSKVIEKDLWIKEGDYVEAFNGANNAIGTLVMKFDTSEELERAITNQKNWLNVVVKK